MITNALIITKHADNRLTNFNVPIANVVKCGVRQGSVFVPYPLVLYMTRRTVR